MMALGNVETTGIYADYCLGLCCWTTKIAATVKIRAPERFFKKKGVFCCFYRKNRV